MPRYFFHRTDGGFDPDTEGTELANLEAARVEAVRFAAGSIQDNPDHVWDGKNFRVEVTDDTGMLLYTIVILGIEASTTRGSEANEPRSGRSEGVKSSRLVGTSIDNLVSP